MEKYIQLKKATFTLHPNGYVIMKLQPRIELNKEDAEQFIETHKKLSPNRSPLLILHTDNYSIDKEAQFVFANDNFPTAIAIVAKTSILHLASNVVFKLFSVMKKKFIPRKIFWTEQDAIAWLNQITTEQAKKPHSPSKNSSE